MKDFSVSFLPHLGKNGRFPVTIFSGQNIFLGSCFELFGPKIWTSIWQQWPYASNEQKTSSR
jgi:hypothetical protein